MVILIEHKICARARFLLRLFRCERITVEHNVILGMKVLKMSVPLEEDQSKRRLACLKKQALSIMEKFRINTVFFREDFPYKDWFSVYRQPDGRELVKRLLGKLTVMAAEAHDLVLICMQRLSKGSRGAIIELCNSFRHVALIGDYGEQIADNLMQKYGVSVITNPSRQKLAMANAVVLFDASRNALELGEECIAVAAESCFYENISGCKKLTDVEFSACDGKSFDLPNGYPQKALIFEAILRGSIHFEDINISKLKCQLTNAKKA